jgi:hypothetical protein
VKLEDEGDDLERRKTGWEEMRGEGRTRGRRRGITIEGGQRKQGKVDGVKMKILED